MSFNYLRTQKNFSKKMSTDWWDNFSIDSILKKRTFACHVATSDLQIEKSYKKPSKPTLCQKQLAAPTCVRWDFSNSLALFSVFSIGSISSKRLTERGHKTDLSPWITPTQRFWLLNGGCSREIGEAIFQPNTNERCATTNLLPLNAALRTWFTSFVIEKNITCNCCYIVLMNSKVCRSRLVCFYKE